MTVSRSQGGVDHRQNESRSLSEANLSSQILEKMDVQRRQIEALGRNSQIRSEQIQRLEEAQQDSQNQIQIQERAIEELSIKNRRLERRLDEAESQTFWLKVAMVALAIVCIITLVVICI